MRWNYRRVAARDQYREAVLLSADVLLEARAGFINISRLEPRAYRRFALVYRNQPDMSPEVTMFMNYIRSYSDEFPRYRRHVLDHALRTNKKIHLER